MDYQCYIMESAYLKGLSHAKKNLELKLESMGLLIGQVNSYNGKNYIMVNDYITSENRSTAVLVKFTQAALSNLTEMYSKRQDKNLFVIGWMHSHPSYGCFLSNTDITTQTACFNQPNNIAVVIDPILIETKPEEHIRVFKLDESDNRKYSEVSFAIIKKKNGGEWFAKN